MVDRKPYALTEPASSYAEERMKQDGYSSVEEYVETLVYDDYDVSLRQEWLRNRVEEGIASGSAGVLTRTRIRRLVRQGIARAQRLK